MANLIIKPQNTSGDKVIIQDQAGGAVLTTADSGATIANATLVAPALGTPASGVVTNLSGVLPGGVTGGSGLNNLPNKHNRCISRATFTGFNATSADPINNSWVITNIGNSDEIMTQSGGIFSFPSTGIWRFQLRASAYNSTSTSMTAESVGIDGHISTNSGSSWTHKMTAINHLDFPANDWYRVPLFSEFIFDITDASTFRLKFTCGTNPANNVHWGGGTENGSFWFIKLGET